MIEDAMHDEMTNCGEDSSLETHLNIITNPIQSIKTGQVTGGELKIWWFEMPQISEVMDG